MPAVKSNFSKVIRAVIVKDAVCELRTRYVAGALSMFALTTLSSVSMSLAGIALTPAVASALLWVILFFCAMAGLSRIFLQEQEAGTLQGLQLYAPGLSVFLGKLLFNLLLLTGLTLLVVPLFIIFFNAQVAAWPSLVLVLALGNAGIAAVSTLTAAMIMYVQGKHTVFSVLTFPVLLPQFLNAISATAGILGGSVPEGSAFLFLAGYDAAMVAAGILLFDYLWQA